MKKGMEKRLSGVFISEAYSVESGKVFSNVNRDKDLNIALLPPRLAHLERVEEEWLQLICVLSFFISSDCGCTRC